MNNSTKQTLGKRALKLLMNFTMMILFVLKITGKKGTVTYTIKRVSRKKFRKYFRINRKNGALTVKKGLKKGTYRVYIKVRVSGNISYKAATRTVAVKVRVK